MVYAPHGVNLGISKYICKVFFYADFVALYMYSEITPAKQHIMDSLLSPKEIMIS